jgi:formylglycine-generating enzyme required for sulfatase activity
MGKDGEAHKVTLDAFYIGKYPVTNAEYERYMDDIRRAFEIPAGKVADHPVVEISWYDARDYAAWAGMRLLTEAEWEKAASWDEGRRTKGEKPEGRKRKYPWGDGFDENRCNTRELYSSGTTPVGEYSPQGDSPYGCADMAGNVWEWTSSLYEDYPYRADDGREDMASSDLRVMRGGSFHSNVDDARCAVRDGSNPNFRYVNIGVRVGVAAAP